MRQSNLTRFSFFIPVLLIAVLFVYTNTRIVAQNQGSKLPGCIQELLTGKTSDISSALSQLSDSDLPTALASIELLKFKALHHEISLTNKDITLLKKLIINRIDKSSTVSFTETDTCKQKVAEAQISFDGQNISVPQYFTADKNLSIISFSPSGEAGTIFPEFIIEFSSKSAITKQTLTIDGKEYSTYRAVTEGTPLIYQPDIIQNNMLSIGTHTAKIIINNKDGETVSKEWKFTVGVKDISTPPLPESAKVIKELDINPEKVLPKQKLNGKLSVIVYRDKNGKIYTEYKLKTPTGQVIKSRNLAFIRRRITGNQREKDEIIISPKTNYAFVGNTLHFTYEWSGDGKVVSEKWSIKSGQNVTTQPTIEIEGYVTAQISLTIERTGVDQYGEEFTYTVDVSNTRNISTIEVSTHIFTERNLIISNAASCTFNLAGRAEMFLFQDLIEGKEYSLIPEGNGTALVSRMRWKVISSDADAKIVNPLATDTQLILTKNGNAEIVLDIQLTWSQFGETYKSNYKPSTSALYGFYPVSGKAEFKKYPRGQLEVSSRHIVADSFEFKIRDQKRILKSPDDFELSEPINICESSLWPASSPIKITRAELFVARKGSVYPLDKVGPFIFKTPSTMSGHIAMDIAGVFKYGDSGYSSYDESACSISSLPSIPSYSGAEVVNLTIEPSENVTIPEGKDTEFTATVLPVDGMGSGAYSESDSSLNILDGYKVSSVENIFWYEEPMGDVGDWKKKALKTLDYSHIFDPILGSGSYNLHCGFVMKLREPDTGEDASVYIENKVPVEVTPGLHIFSPFDEMTYPLYSSLKVLTSLDGETDLESWRKIKWKLNGKAYKPDSSEPPFSIYFDHEGSWNLEAELETTDPVTGEDMLLKDSVSFNVKAVDLLLSPHKKVLSYKNTKAQAINLSISANNDSAENFEDSFLWDEDFEIYAKVSNIEWSVVSKNDCATLDSAQDSFDATLNFTSVGAATVLATVTIKLQGAEKLFYKHNPRYRGAFVWPELTFSAVRADIWAIEASPMSNFLGALKPEAIAKAYKTYKLDSFDFSVHGSSTTDHKYNHGKIDPAVKLKSALSDTSVTTSQVDLNWSAEGVSETSGNNSDKFVVKPKEAGPYNVSLEPTLVFNKSNKVNMGVKDFDLKPVDLSTLIDAKVTPDNFTLAFGEKQLLTCEINGHSNADNSPILLLGGAYILKNKLDWSEINVPSSKTGDSFTYEFLAKEPGVTLGQTKLTMVVNEVLPNDHGPDSDKYVKTIDWKCNVSAQKEIIINPLEGMIYPLHSSLKVVTNYDGAPDIWKKIKWKLNGAAYTPDVSTSTFYLNFDHEGDWKLEAELTIYDENTGKEILLKDAVNFTVKAIDIKLSPSRKVLDYKKDHTQSIKLSISANGNTAEEFKDKILWDKKNKIYAKVTNIAWSVKSTNDKTKLDAKNDNLNATLNFSGADTATVQATVTVQLIGVERLLKKYHPDYKGELELQVFTPPSVRADTWAVKADEMTEIKGLFPDKAVVGLDRTFQVKSFKFKINGALHYYSELSGVGPKVELEPAITGVPSAKASILYFDWFAESLKKNTKPNDGNKFMFKPILEKPHKVKFVSKLAFEDAKVEIGEYSKPVNVFLLDDLLHGRVDPASFTLNLGETKTLTCKVWTDDVTHPANAKGDKLTILDGAYELEIKDVGWHENAVPAKQEAEPSTYNFIAKKPGKVNGDAEVRFVIREVLADDINPVVVNYTKDISWQAYIQSLKLTILINGKPAGSENYYLGQRINLGYELVSSNKKRIKLDNPKWEISGIALKKYKFSQFNNSVDYKYLENVDLESDSVSVILYCGSGEKSFKTITVKGYAYYKYFEKTINVRVKHPVIVSEPPQIPKAKLFTIQLASSTFSWLGFESNNPVVYEPTVSNNTGINYTITSLQLVITNHWRKVATEGVKLEQVAQTLPLEKLWLDRWFPYGVTHKLDANQTSTIKELFNDTPSVVCDDDLYDEVLEIHADAKYVLFIMAKPDQPTNPYFKDVSWIPIKAYTWSWKVYADRDSDDKWYMKTANSETFKELLFKKPVNWLKVANDKTLKWRNK